ncbi:MAG: c-type cytochrome [Myxococcales bacterium]|nr:c-type cytochrome [Myxococcales bacterium]
MTPIPRDLPLPLPASAFYLEPLLVVAFVAHIVFVNLLVGSSLLVFGLELRGRKDRDFDRLARALATTLTVNKSLAVVLGVAPLLIISVLYTMQFYTANALTGTAWIGLIPGITVTFVLLYLHKYSWDRLQDAKGTHLGILGIAVALLLFIPLVFLTNVNLMTFPDRWTAVRGFLDALTLPNVLPRYLHFLGASLVLTSLFCVAWFGRASYPVEEVFERLTRPQLRRMFYSVAFVVSLAQFVIGPVVLLTLPSRGINAVVLAEIGAGVALAIPAVWMLWKEMVDPESGRRFFKIVGLLTVTVLMMALGRHNYRYVALREHRRAVARETAAWQLASEAARVQARTGVPAAGAAPDGAALFASSCSGCHAKDTRLVGPPLTEIAQVYQGNPAGIVAWAKAPGKKRADMPPMPAMAAVGDANLRAIAEYMLKAGAP